MPYASFCIGFLGATQQPDPQAVSNLRVLLWGGLVVLVLLFGLVVLLTVLRIVRRRYFKQTVKPASAHESPWKAAGQRAVPVEGGQLVDGATPDDAPDAYLREGKEPLHDEDSSGDTGPLPEDDEADDEGDGLRW